MLTESTLYSAFWALLTPTPIYYTPITGPVSPPILWGAPGQDEPLHTCTSPVSIIRLSAYVGIGTLIQNPPPDCRTAAPTQTLPRISLGAFHFCTRIIPFRSPSGLCTGPPSCLPPPQVQSLADSAGRP